jgi:hypothetical protein
VILLGAPNRDYCPCCRDKVEQMIGSSGNAPEVMGKLRCHNTLTLRRLAVRAVVKGFASTFSLSILEGRQRSRCSWSAVSPG